MEFKMLSIFVCVLFLIYLSFLDGFFLRIINMMIGKEKVDKIISLFFEGLYFECKNFIFFCRVFFKCSFI